MSMPPHTERRQAGFSLVELLIAMTIGALVVAAIGFAFVASRQAQRSGDGMARIQETARTASLILDSSVRLAGYRPDPRNQPDPAAIFRAPRTAVSGASHTAPAYNGIANAIATADYVAIAFIGNDDMSLRTCLGDVVPADKRAFMVFFLSKQLNDDSPSLSCATELAAVTSAGPVVLSRNEPIQQGVNNMTIRYGIDSDGDLQIDRYVDAEGVASITDWSHVKSVEISLSTQSEVVAARQADVPLRLAGGRLNRPIRQTIALRNRLVP